MEGVAVRRVATPSMHWQSLTHYSMYWPDRDADWLMHTHALLWLTVCRISVLPPGECNCTNVGPNRDSMTSHAVTIGQNEIHKSTASFKLFQCCSVLYLFVCILCTFVLLWHNNKYI